MKLLLIEPNIEGRVGEPPLNIAILKAFINNNTDHSSKIVDLTFHKAEWKNYLSLIIKSKNWDLIGISCLSFNYTQALKRGF